jgi:hypothetical protein
VKPWLRKGNGGMAAAQNGRLFLGDLDPVTAGLTAQVVSRPGVWVISIPGVGSKPRSERAAS